MKLNASKTNMMIYCNGASFTAGTELVDIDLFKDSYPKILNKNYLDSEQTDRDAKYFDWWCNNAFKLFSSLPTDDRNKIITKEKSRAWPAKLEKLLNIQTYNSASMGLSMEAIARNTITDILTLDIPINLVIIQLPPIERIEVIYKNNAYTVSFSNTKHWIPEIKNLTKSLVMVEDDYSLQRRYIFSLMQLYDFCKTKNIKLMILGVKNISQELDIDNKLAHLKNHIIDSIYPYSMSDEVEKLTGAVYCPGGHYTEIVHDAFARTLATSIKSQKLI